MLFWEEDCFLIDLHHECKGGYVCEGKENLTAWQFSKPQTRQTLADLRVFALAIPSSLLAPLGPTTPGSSDAQIL